MSLFFLNKYIDTKYCGIITQIKKEKAFGNGCKGEPMDTTSSSMSVTNEEKKPDIKKEPKEEEEGVRSTGPNSSTPSSQSKKKGKSEILHLCLHFKQF